MSGALAERVFVHKITSVGFGHVEVLDRRSFGVDDVALYPLFTADLIELMRTLVAPEQQAEIATAVIVSARKPTGRSGSG